jgi:hypothetical protein
LEAYVHDANVNLKDTTDLPELASWVIKFDELIKLCGAAALIKKNNDRFDIQSGRCFF